MVNDTGDNDSDLDTYDLRVTGTVIGQFDAQEEVDVFFYQDLPENLWVN